MDFQVEVRLGSTSATSPSMVWMMSDLHEMPIQCTFPFVVGHPRLVAESNVHNLLIF